MSLSEFHLQIRCCAGRLVGRLVGVLVYSSVDQSVPLSSNHKSFFLVFVKAIVMVFFMCVSMSQE